MTRPATPLRFALVFALWFAAFTTAFEASRGSAFERFAVEQVLLAPTVGIVNLITPNEHLHLNGRVLRSSSSQLRVTRGCEGIELFLLLLAGILAFPATPRQRLHGLIVGGLLAYALSLGRLMALHYVLRYAPAWWQTLHGLVLSLLPVIVLAGFFLYWTESARSATPASAIAVVHNAH
jgi:exosortase family protein XrtM